MFVSLRISWNLITHFRLNVTIKKKCPVKKQVYNWKRADLNGLKHAILHTPWDFAFEENCIDTSVASWMDLFLTIADEHIPKITVTDTDRRLWLDRDILRSMRRKDKLRRIAKITGDQKDAENFAESRREAKRLVETKYKEYVNGLKTSLLDHPKRFWAFVKDKTKNYSTPAWIFELWQQICHRLQRQG